VSVSLLVQFQCFECIKSKLGGLDLSRQFEKGHLDSSKMTSRLYKTKVSTVSITLKSRFEKRPLDVSRHLDLDTSRLSKPPA
jgi:hypothetical protein